MKLTLDEQLQGRCPDPMLLTALLGGLGRARKAELACSLLFTVREKGARIDMFHDSAAISACEKGRQWQLAVSLLAEMAVATIRKDVIVHNSAISACEKGGQWQTGPRPRGGRPQVA